MSPARAEMRRAVISRLTDGPLLTSEIIAQLEGMVNRKTDPTADAVKAAIWDLAEAQDAVWLMDARVSLTEKGLLDASATATRNKHGELPE